MYFDVPLLSQPNAADTFSSPTLTGPHQQASNSQSLPLYNQSSVSGQAVNSSDQPSAPIRTSNILQAQSTLPYIHQSALSGGQPNSGKQRKDPDKDGQFIYCCINTGDTYAQSIEVNARSLTDHSFSNKLLSEYTVVKGWWHQLWIMTSCCGASFKKVHGLVSPELLK